MTKKTLFQGIALINFLCLMAIFVFYKNGSLGNLLFEKNHNYITSPNGGTAAKNANDSLKIYTDSVKQKRFLMSTSKSLVITDNLQMNIDTTFLKKLFDTIKLNNDSLKPKIKK